MSADTGNTNSTPHPAPSTGGLVPNDHVRAIIELLRPATPDLARRWLAALLIVPDAEREAVVAAVEKRIVDTYAAPRGPQADELDRSPANDAPEQPEPRLRVVYPPAASKPKAKSPSARPRPRAQGR